MEAVLDSCVGGATARNAHSTVLDLPSTVGGREVLDLYQSIFLAREVDRVEMELVHRGEGFFHVGGAGHEASAALQTHLTPDDWLHLHYRDKALMIARGLPLDQFFHSLLCTAQSHSGGRQMSAHLSSPELRLLSLVGPVGNQALQAAGVAHEIRNLPSSPIVVCAMGDGTSQQGEVLEAIAEAVRAPLPVLFLVEDNRLAISTQTRGRTFYDLPSGPSDTFYGLPVHRIDGRHPLDCRSKLGPIVHGIRRLRFPALVVLQVERLTHHTNADDERVYREASKLKAIRDASDPLTVLRRDILRMGLPLEKLEACEAEWSGEVRAAAERALHSPNPLANLEARPPWPTATFHRSEYRGSPNGQTTMLEAIRQVLHRRLDSDTHATLFGEDVEDPKGDVFGLTRGLSTQFPDRVQNTALTESTIAGIGIGRALAGGHPIGCIQFADFIPLAFNQIASEMGSLHWRSMGGWSVPLVLMAPCGGYRPGLGPFHAQTFESILAHVPGIDVVMPSTAGDAAGLLNSVFAGGRPTVFLYPKVCLNDPSVATSEDLDRHWVQPGKARWVTHGDSLTIVTWGGTVPLCTRVAEWLAGQGTACDLIDLRSLSPWDDEAVCGSATKTGRLLVVHEDSHTCGFGAEVVATVAEKCQRAIQSRRVTRPDTYVPCNYVNQLDVLPSFQRILDAAAALCGIEIDWVHERMDSSSAYVLEAVGSSPADQNVAVIEWRVRSGQAVGAGDLIAECEADKATFELRAPVAGSIRDLIAEGEKVPVGAPLAKIDRSYVGAQLPRRLPVEPKPNLRSKPREEPLPRPVSPNRNGQYSHRGVVGISTIQPAYAGRVVTNEELIARFPGRTAADIFQRTGIESRRLLAEGETVLTLATRAASSALSDIGISATGLDAIFVSTSSPISLSPSLACLLHHQLSLLGPTRDIPSSDILAACSGYLYALQAASDFCLAQPDATILVVTAEAMSTFTDPNDFDTAIVFADGATASIVHGPESSGFGKSRLLLKRPILSARGEDGSILNHGRRERPTVNMDGLKVFPMAVRQLIALLKEASQQANVRVEDLDYIVPHQANGRILDAVDSRLKLPKGRLVNRVCHSGNTSSSTIPMVLAELLTQQPRAGSKVGLCSFGGGFTFGAAVMEFT